MTTTLASPNVAATAPLPAAARTRDRWQFWGRMLVLPYVLVVLVFVLYPVGYGLCCALYRTQEARGASDHEKSMGAVPGQLVYQSELPVQIGLHRFTRIIGAFVRAAIAVDTR